MKPGTRLYSHVCDTEVIVVGVPADDLEIACGGVTMSESPPQAKAGEPVTGLDSGTQLGKRYAADSAPGLELLVVKAGRGSLTADGYVLGVKAAKALPASD
jgi:hypothetical protein